ncbi:hypothetical protein F5B20DRAFT_546146 [Whalleya microplaca]|nr:hypothetical protein F5B20DRAFT_546146 [Whalleya microplaca]
MAHCKSFHRRHFLKTQSLRCLVFLSFPRASTSRHHFTYLRVPTYPSSPSTCNSRPGDQRILFHIAHHGRSLGLR